MSDDVGIDSRDRFEVWRDNAYSSVPMDDFETEVGWSAWQAAEADALERWKKMCGGDGCPGCHECWSCGEPKCHRCRNESPSDVQQGPCIPCVDAIQAAERAATAAAIRELKQ